MAKGQFSGEPEARWLTEAGPDRDMTLTEAFWFKDAKSRRWDAPAGSEVNGASIPRFLWAVVGSPYTGDYRRASIVHDVACDAAIGSPAARRAADRMFFEACREGGCSRWDATVLYIGVRFGAWFHRSALVEDRSVRLSEPGEFEGLRRDFRTVAEDVLSRGETDDPDEVEARTDAAFAALATRKAALHGAVALLTGE